MNYLDKLCSLYTFNCRDLLNYIQENFVIGGGVIVWLLSDNISTRCVGDIDVFINNSQQYLDLIAKFHRNPVKVIYDDSLQRYNNNIMLMLSI